MIRTNTGLLIAMMAVGMIAAPVAAQEPTDGSASAAPVKEKKICRKIVATGTMLGRSYCLTKTEWKEFNDINEQNAEFAGNRKITGLKRPTNF